MDLSKFLFLFTVFCFSAAISEGGRVRVRAGRLNRHNQLKSLKHASVTDDDRALREAVERAVLHNNLNELESQGCSRENAREMLNFGKPERGVKHYPSCVSVKRCSGCCLGNRVCKPTEETVSISVIEMKAPHIADITLEDIAKAPIIQVNATTHTACNCECPDKAAEKTCRRNGMTWNSMQCLCMCEYVLECYNGYFFSKETCDCEMNPGIAHLQNTLRDLFPSRRISLKEEENYSR